MNADWLVQNWPENDRSVKTFVEKLLNEQQRLENNVLTTKKAWKIWLFERIAPENLIGQSQIINDKGYRLKTLEKCHCLSENYGKKVTDWKENITYLIGQDGRQIVFDDGKNNKQTILTVIIL